MRCCKVAALAVMLVLAFVGALQAQSTNGTVTGRVTDPSKAVIPDVKITLINMATNLQYKGTTNGGGSYNVINLPAGRYRMEVEKVGFKTVIKPDIVLHVQDALEINFEMALGSLSESLTVEGGAPTVQLTTSSISAVVNSTTVLELPLHGRDWTQLAILQPGVTSVGSIQPAIGGTNMSARVNRGFGMGLSVSGGR